MRNLLLLFVLVAVATSGCRKSDSADANKTLHIYTWSEYLPQSVIDQFTQRTGIKVTVDTYDNNEVLQSKLQSGVADYDLVCPTDYMIKLLIAQKLIQPLDKSKLSNLQNIDPRFLNKPFDPDNAYSAPYLWGTTGFGYNKQVITGPVDSWQVLFDDKYANKVLMLNDVRECFAAALKLSGKSLNTTDEAALKQAGEVLKKQKVKTYDSDDYDNVLASGEVVIAHGFNGQLAKLAAKHPDKFAYVLPKEGCTMSQDALCIPTKAKNVEAAHQFIQFIHEPQVNAEIVNSTGYASTNADAKAHVRSEILSNPAVYPPENLLKNCELMEDIGQATELLDRLWTEIKAR